MGIEQRKHIRFSLDIPASRYTRSGEAIETVVTQISIGGCLADWDENVYVGDEFRMLLQLPNKNFLPLMCKAIYKFADNGIGAKFIDITLYEQELIAKIIFNTLREHGLPLQVDPFTQPRKMIVNDVPQLSSFRRDKEEMLENIL